MSDPNVDELLRNFLLAEAQSRSRGITVEALYEAVKRVANDQAQIRIDVSRLVEDRRRDRADITRLQSDAGRYGRRIGAIENQVELVSAAPPMTDVPNFEPDPKEITGTWQFATLKAEHDAIVQKTREEEERKRESAMWWKRQSVVWLVAATGALMLAAISGCVTYAVAQLSRPTPQLSK